MKITIFFLLLVALGLHHSSGAEDIDIHTAAKAGDVTKVKALLTTQPELVNAKDATGATPLHWVGNPAVAELLLTHKADVNAKDNQGLTPLQWAARERSPVAKWLRQHGEPATSSPDGKTESH